VTEGGSSHLDGIVAGVQEALALRKAALPFEEVVRRASENRQRRDIRTRLKGLPGVIAEIKRASPSKGWISRQLDVGETVRSYLDGGACAISVLTEERRFGGSLGDLSAVSALSGEVPVLRKDFLLDEYMVAEARAFGADMVLLMVSVLGEGTRGLLEAAGRHGVEALVEVHDERELETALAAGATIVGINNRNLKTLQVDLSTGDRLLPLVPASVLKVVESGISTAEDVRRFRSSGADAFLVGETLVRSEDPGRKIRELLGAGASPRTAAR
jgi:indole-3-glycerol phosphate synthase